MYTSYEYFRCEYKFSYNINYHFNLISVKVDLTSTKDMRSDSVIYYNYEKSDYLF